MKAEIFSIGTELLLGQILDTNAQFLSQELANLGINVYYRKTVGDNHERLTNALKEAFRTSDLIICTGGLGPTEDDITAKCVADSLSRELYLNEIELKRLENLFTSRGRVMTKNQAKQVHFPIDSIIIPNPTGTAPGFILTVDGKTAIVLPGPPKEMEPMWRETVVPYLRGIANGVIIHSLTLRYSGIGEAALEEELKELIHSEEKVTIAPYAKRGEVHIRLTACSPCESAAESEIQHVLSKIKLLNSAKYLYGYNENSLEQVVGKALKTKGLTLCVAESCTGGSLGARITDVNGSSEYFLGGVISYANEIKQELLEVKSATLEAVGAVSERTALEMASGAKKRFNADIALSITGIAGPDGGTDEKPVGTVYIGIATSKDVTAHHFNFWGRRDDIRYRACQEALRLLREEIGA